MTEGTSQPTRSKDWEEGYYEGLRRAALVVSCGCAGADAVQMAVTLHGKNSAARWHACPQPECAALTAIEIRALLDREPWPT